MNRRSISSPQILVVGLARSGTTWLAKMLDSHPATLYRHEPDYAPIFPVMPFIVDPGRADQYQSDLLAFAYTLRGLDRVRQSGPPPFFPKNAEGHLTTTDAARLSLRQNWWDLYSETFLFPTCFSLPRMTDYELCGSRCAQWEESARSWERCVQSTSFSSFGILVGQFFPAVEASNKVKWPQSRARR